MVFKYNSKLSNLVTKNALKTKADNIPGVYKINCGGCDKLYIGETGRNLSIRVKEHKKDVQNRHQINKKLSSGIVSHTDNCFHNFDFDNSKMLFPCNDLSKRHIIESALINLNREKCVNLNDGFAPFGNYVSKSVISCLFRKNTIL